MIRTCERCGLNYPANGKHNCSCLPPQAANQNSNIVEFDEKAWRRGYMREYMRRRRARLKVVVDGGVANQEGREA